MHILFLTVVRIQQVQESGIYTDLIRQLKAVGHDVSVICPSERRFRQATRCEVQDGITVLSVWTPNIQKTSLFEKGISTLAIERIFLRAFKKYLDGRKVDLVLYSTPPITFTGLVKYFKKSHQARSYLLLKDIFPQNAVDLAILKQGGLIYRYFRKKEKELYRVSDYIGCMSPANATYLINRNPGLTAGKVEVCPNSIIPRQSLMPAAGRLSLREVYGIPETAIACVYAGNLGKPQGIDFLLQVLESNANDSRFFFLIVGSGTEFARVQKWFTVNSPLNAVLCPAMSKEACDAVVQSCDIGLIFLDARFTIPNFPSRLLTYMEFGLPVVSATDAATDIGSISEHAGFGLSGMSGDLVHFNKNLATLAADTPLRVLMGRRSRSFLEENYTAKQSCNIILHHFEPHV
jgi:glycosyltransferase involved in cell wall biosynthesis